MKYLSLLLVSALLFTACGHTNRLAQFKVNGRSALYRTTVSVDAAASLAVIEPPSKNTAVDIAATIGSVILSDQSRRKLERAINRDQLGGAVGNGMRQATADYLGIKAVGDIGENPELIIETTVTDCKLFSNSAGLWMRVSGESRMIDRATGQIVWENSETHTVPISETYLAAVAPRGIASGASIYNAVQFLSMSEEEIRKLLVGAAGEAGREIGETLREDVAELSK